MLEKGEREEKKNIAPVVLSSLPVHKRHVSISVHNVYLSLVILSTGLLHVDSTVWRFALGTSVSKFSIFGLGKIIAQHLKDVYLWFPGTWLLRGEWIWEDVLSLYWRIREDIPPNPPSHPSCLCPQLEGRLFFAFFTDKLFSCKVKFRADIVAHNCNHSTWEVQAGGSPKIGAQPSAFN